MTRRTSRRWSWALLIVGGVLFFFAGLAGWLNSAVVNGNNFAAHANAVRHDPDVQRQVGGLVAGAAVDADPDLIAIRPALEGAASALVGSSAFDGSFEATVRSFHGAMTSPGSSSAVLALADLGATVTTAIEKFFPQAAGMIPANLNLTLAEVGGQQGVAAAIIPLIQAVSVLAWVLPLLAILMIALGVWVAPQRRVSLVRTGWILITGGALMGVLVIAALGVGAASDKATLSGAVTAAALGEFIKPLTTRFIATVLIGGLLVGTAGAFLPQFEPHRYLNRAAGLLSWRPENPSAQVVRALVIVGVGVGIVFYPTLSAQLLAIVAGLFVFFFGVAELDRVAEKYLAEDEARQTAAESAPGRHSRGMARKAWIVPALAALVAAVVVGALLVPQALPQKETTNAAASDPDGCNGYVALCDKPFNNVAMAGSHNSMSAADEKGWFLAEQPTGIVNSLDDGIRVLLVDTWYGQKTASGNTITAEQSVAAAEKEMTATYGPEIVASAQRTIDRIRGEKGVGPVEPYFCHTFCELGATQVLPVLKGIRAWLEAHPREVITIFIQDMVTPADTAKVFDQVGLTDLTFTFTPGQPWPTLRQMIDTNKRVMVLMENTGGGAAYPWLQQGFDLVQDTPYTFGSQADFSCALQRGKPTNPLFGINHWLASFTHLVTNAEKVNAYPVLSKRVKECQAQRGMIPNMIAVNWYDRGALLQVVAETNGVAP